MHSELPPSSADKWMNCHGWLNLNRDRPEKKSEAADEGTLAHSLFEYLILENGGRPEEIGHLPKPSVPEEMHDRVSAMVDWVFEQDGEIFVEEMYDYGSQFGFSNLYGTSDCTLVETDRLTVCDLKYGYGLVEVEENHQLLIYLSGAVARFGPRETYRLVILQPRANHGDGTIREWTLTHAELESFNKRLEHSIAKNYKGGKPTAGDHCRKYCKALGSCPAAAKRAIQIFKENPIE